MIIHVHTSKLMYTFLSSTYRISRPCGFRQEEFSCFPFLNRCKTCDPQGVDHFWPYEQNLKKKMMINTKYQRFRPFGFREDFKVFNSKIYF